jgi:membrane protease YdiL (CAAX protease family)
VIAPRVWPVFVAVVSMVPLMIAVWIAAFVVWFVVHGMIGTGSSAGSQTQVQQALTEPLMLIPVMAAISLGNAGIAVSGAWLSPMKIRDRLAVGRGTGGWVSLPLLVVGTLAFGMASVNFIGLLGIRPNQGTEQVLAATAGKSSPAEMAALFVVVSLFPAVCEELLFRGYAQTRLVARWGPVWGIGITAVMFGLIHMDPVQTPDMILVGSYLGWAAWRSGSTRTSVICHLVNNAVAIGLSMLPSMPAAASGDGASRGQMLIMIGIGLAVCAPCTWLAARLLPKPVLTSIESPTATSTPRQ